MSQALHPPIVLTGSVAFDRIMTFDGSFAELIQPDKLHVLSVSPIVHEMKITRGGTAGNIAYTLACLGEKPILYSCVGPDATEYMQALAAKGVNTSCLHVSSLYTSTFSVLNDKKNCQVGGFYPGAMSDTKSLTLHTFCEQKPFVVISAHDPETMIRHTHEAKSFGLRYCFDPGQQVHILTGEELRQAISGAEVLIMNDYEVGLVQQKTALSERELAQQVPVFVVTLGEQGCRVYEKSTKDKELKHTPQHAQPLHINAAHVKEIKDPTGAGDAFRGGFLYGYIRKYPVVVCAQLGSVAATYAVETYGTQEHMFSKKEFMERYAKEYGKMTEEEKYRK